MKIQDCLISRKPFKRPDYLNWLIVFGGAIIYEKEEMKKFTPALGTVDLLSNDWMIKIEKNINQDELRSAMHWAWLELSDSTAFTYSNFVDRVITKLGFKGLGNDKD